MLTALNNRFPIPHSGAANKVPLVASPQQREHLAFTPILKLRTIIFAQHVHLVCSSVPSQHPQGPLALLLLLLKPCPAACRHPCPQGIVSRERSRFPALHHPVWTQHSACCTSEFPWKKPSPLLPLFKGGKQTTNKAISCKSNDTRAKSIHRA